MFISAENLLKKNLLGIPFNCNLQLPKRHFKAKHRASAYLLVRSQVRRVVRKGSPMEVLVRFPENRLVGHSAYYIQLVNNGVNLAVENNVPSKLCACARAHKT